MFYLICNPISGQGTALKVEPKLKALLKEKQIEYQLVHTEAPLHATELARSLAHEGDTVIAVGGDGLSSEVLRGLKGTGAAFGIVPCGTGNDFVKSIGVPRDPVEALRFILEHEPKKADACFLNGEPFMNVCGTGFDVSVLEHAESAKKRFRGLIPYMIGLIKAIQYYEPVEVRLEADGVVENRRLLICSVANGRFIGGGIPICPVADPADGKLDLVLVQGVRRNQIWYHIPGLLMGSILKWTGLTEHRLVDRVVIDCEGMKLNVDGEIRQMDTAEFTIQPGALLLYRAD